MKYRDERDAMRQRADNLEDQLEEANKQLRDAQTRLAQQQQEDEEEEHKISQLQSEVDHLRGRLGLPTRPGAAQQPARVKMALVAGILVLAGAGVGFFVILASSDAPEEGPSEATAHAPVDVRAVGTAKPVTGPPLKPSDVALFGAEVIAESGGKVKVGDGCVLRAELRHGPQIGEVQLSCGSTVLYRSTDPRGSGTNLSNRGISELSASDKDAWRYSIKYVDRGQHSGSRAEIDVDTPTHRGRVYREGTEAWSVSLHIRDVSFPRWGAALDAKSSMSTPPEPLHLVATPTARKGPVPTTVSEGPCELRLRHSPGDRNCRVMLRCGNNIIYGAGSGGFANCATDGGFARAVDDKRSGEDKDPSMLLEWSKRTIVVEDDAAGESWTVTFALEERPGCGFDGQWVGEGTDEGGTLWSFGWTANSETVEMKWKSPRWSGVEKAVIDGTCAHDRLQIQGKEVSNDKLVATRYAVEMGPGWQSFGGRWMTGRPGVLAGVRR